MASYYQQKAERQKLLRAVKAQQRATATALEKLERELNRLRSRKNILDAHDINVLIIINDAVHKAQQSLDNALSNFANVLQYE